MVMAMGLVWRVGAAVAEEGHGALQGRIGPNEVEGARPPLFSGEKLSIEAWSFEKADEGANDPQNGRQLFSEETHDDTPFVSPAFCRRREVSPDDSEEMGQN
jgi:hypothetical protein